MIETMTLSAAAQMLGDLQAVYAQAHNYMRCRERAYALQLRSQETPGSLAEAIERDFMAFELEDAARALCEAVRLAEQARDGAAQPLPIPQR